MDQAKDDLSDSGIGTTPRIKDIEANKDTVVEMKGKNLFICGFGVRVPHCYFCYPNTLPEKGTRLNAEAATSNE